MGKPQVKRVPEGLPVRGEQRESEERATGCGLQASGKWHGQASSEASARGLARARWAERKWRTGCGLQASVRGAHAARDESEARKGLHQVELGAAQPSALAGGSWPAV